MASGRLRRPKEVYHLTGDSWRGRLAAADHSPQRTPALSGLMGKVFRQILAPTPVAGDPAGGAAEAWRPAGRAALRQLPAAVGAAKGFVTHYDRRRAYRSSVCEPCDRGASAHRGGQSLAGRQGPLQRHAQELEVPVAVHPPELLLRLQHSGRCPAQDHLA